MAHRLAIFGHGQHVGRRTYALPVLLQILEKLLDFTLRPFIRKSRLSQLAARWTTKQMCAVHIRQEAVIARSNNCPQFIIDFKRHFTT
jgi:hypothetical protein